MPLLSNCLPQRPPSYPGKAFLTWGTLATSTVFCRASLHLTVWSLFLNKGFSLGLNTRALGPSPYA